MKCPLCARFWDMMPNRAGDLSVLLWGDLDNKQINKYMSKVISKRNKCLKDKGQRIERMADGFIDRLPREHPSEVVPSEPRPQWQQANPSKDLAKTVPSRDNNFSRKKISLPFIPEHPSFLSWPPISHPLRSYKINHCLFHKNGVQLFISSHKNLWWSCQQSFAHTPSCKKKKPLMCFCICG